MSERKSKCPSGNSRSVSHIGGASIAIREDSRVSYNGNIANTRIQGRNCGAKSARIIERRSREVRTQPLPFSSRVLSTNSVGHIFPRSRAEEDILNGTNNSSRHRQLPCRTFISTGFCPYKEHCVYLHDPRIVSKFEVSIFILMYVFLSISLHLTLILRSCSVDLDKDSCQEQGGRGCGLFLLAHAQVQL